MVVRSAALLCLLGTLLFSEVASAYHTDVDRQTDFSAFTLQQNQLRLGLFQLEYAPFGWWTVGTYTAPWLLSPILQGFNFDLYTKIKFLDTGRWALSGRVTYFNIDVKEGAFGNPDQGPVSMGVLPITLAASWVASERWTLNTEAIWVASFVYGEVQSASDVSVQGAGAMSNLQFTLSAELRLSRVVALNLLGRYLPLAVPSQMDTTATLSSGGNARVQAEISSAAVEHSWLIQPGITLSWKSLNVQLGVGYGDIFVPGYRLVVPQKFIVPDFDIFFRF